MKGNNEIITTGLPVVMICPKKQLSENGVKNYEKVFFLIACFPNARFCTDV